MPKRKTFRGNYAQVVSDLCDFFNERHMSAQEMFACFAWFMTNYFDAADGATYARTLASVFDLHARKYAPPTRTFDEFLAWQEMDSWLSANPETKDKYAELIKLWEQGHDITDEDYARYEEEQERKRASRQGFPEK